MSMPNGRDPEDFTTSLQVVSNEQSACVLHRGPYFDLRVADQPDGTGALRQRAGPSRQSEADKAEEPPRENE